MRTASSARIVYLLYWSGAEFGGFPIFQDEKSAVDLPHGQFAFADF